MTLESHPKRSKVMPLPKKRKPRRKQEAFNMKSSNNYAKKLTSLLGRSIFGAIKNDESKKENENIFLFGPAGMIVLR